MDYYVISKLPCSLNDLSSLRAMYITPNFQLLHYSFIDNMMKVALTLVMLMMSAKADVSSRRYMLPMCTTEITRNYKLDIPGRCNPKENVTRIDGITVYKPYKSTVEIPAIACRRETIINECTYYFFGSQVCVETKQIFSAVDPTLCRMAAETRYTTEGSLVPSNDKTLVTNNQLKPKYRYLSTLSIATNNFRLASLSITKDIVSEKLSHLTMGDLSCTGTSCTAESWRIILLSNKTISCDTITSLRNKTLIIHSVSNGHLFEIEGSNIIANKLISCDKKTTQCIKLEQNERSFCTFSGHVLVVQKTTDISYSNFENEETAATAKQLGAAVSGVAHGSLLNINLLKNFFEMALCENARSILISLRGSQRLNPSEVLSLLLEREVQAVYSSGILSQIKCSMVEAYLQPTLMVNGRESDRPLFRVYTGLGTTLSSLRQNRYLSQKITFTASRSSSRMFEFKDRILLYNNSVLAETKPLVKKMSLKSLKIKEKLFTIDDQELLRDFQQLSSSQEEETNQQIRNLIYLEKQRYAAEGLDISGFLENADDTKSSVFVDIIDAFKSTIWSKTEDALDSLSRIYTIIASVVLIVFIVQVIKQYLEIIRSTENDAT